MTPSIPSSITNLKRLPDRGANDRPVIDAILDASLIAHVGFVRDGVPSVVPTLFVRHGDEVLIHGSPASALLRAAKAGSPLCLTVTSFDGLVLARSAFHHSANYRSVIVYGIGRAVEGDERIEFLDLIVDRIVPGRRPHLRPMTRNEIVGTTVIAVALDHASAKVRTGPPGDEEADYQLPIWAGVVPITTGFGEPVPDPANLPELDVPDHVRTLRW